MRVGAYPKPYDLAVAHKADRTIVLTDPSGEYWARYMNPPKPQSRVAWVVAKQATGGTSDSLDVRREGLHQLSELRSRARSHNVSGSSGRVLPA
jgi:hypothetical protein